MLRLRSCNSKSKHSSGFLFFATNQACASIQRAQQNFQSLTSSVRVSNRCFIHSASTQRSLSPLSRGHSQLKSRFLSTSAIHFFSQTIDSSGVDLPKSHSTVVPCSPSPRRLSHLGSVLTPIVTNALPPLSQLNQLNSKSSPIRPHEQHQRVQNMFKEIDGLGSISFLSNLTPAALQYLLATLFLVEKFPSMLQTVSTAGLQGQLHLNRLEYIIKNRTTKDSGRTSWKSRFPAYSLCGNDQLALFLSGQLKQIKDSIMRYRSAGPSPPTDLCAEVRTGVQYCFKLLHALYDSGLADRLEFLSKPANKQQKNQFGFYSLEAYAGALTTENHMKQSLLLKPVSAHLTSVQSIEFDSMRNEATSLYVPIILHEIMELVSHHADVFIFPEKHLIGDNSTPELQLNSSFHELPSSHPFPSLNPLANIMRLLPLLNSLRHLFASGGLLRNFHSILCLDPQRLRFLQQHGKGDLLLEQDLRNIKLLLPWENTSIIQPTTTNDSRTELSHPSSWPREVSCVDTLFWQLSKADYLYLVQFSCVHRLRTGYSSFLLLFSLYYRFRLPDPTLRTAADRTTSNPYLSQTFTLVELQQLLECVNRFELADHHFVMQIFHQITTVALPQVKAQYVQLVAPSDPDQVPRMIELLQQPAAEAHSPASIPINSLQHPWYMSMPHLAHVLNHSFCSLALALAPLMPPLGFPSDAALNEYLIHPSWPWEQRSHNSHRSGRSVRSPPRVAAILAHYYQTILQHPSLLSRHLSVYHSSRRDELFLQEIVDFTWSVFALDLESTQSKHAHVVEGFLRVFIQWFESNYSFRAKQTSSKLGSLQEANLVSRKGVHISLDLARRVNYRLHQLSIGLRLRCKHAERDRSASASSNDATNTPVRSEGMESGSELNFSTANQGHFASSTHNHKPIISQFQMSVYNVLANPEGKFAFKTMILHDAYHIPHQVKQKWKLEQKAAAASADKSLSTLSTFVPHSFTPDVPPSSPSSGDLYIEFHTDLGYTLDAVLFVEEPSHSADGGGASRGLAIEIDGQYHFCSGKNTMLNCQTRMRKKQLLQAGWKLVNIPYRDWNRLNTDDARAQWLAQRLPSSFGNRPTS